jgi:hypothetical protein
MAEKTESIPFTDGLGFSTPFLRSTRASYGTRVMAEEKERCRYMLEDAVASCSRAVPAKTRLAYGASGASLSAIANSALIQALVVDDHPTLRAAGNMAQGLEAAELSIFGMLLNRVSPAEAAEALRPEDQDLDDRALTITKRLRK